MAESKRISEPWIIAWSPCIIRSRIDNNNNMKWILNQLIFAYEAKVSKNIVIVLKKKCSFKIKNHCLLWIIVIFRLKGERQETRNETENAENGVTMITIWISSSRTEKTEDTCYRMGYGFGDYLCFLCLIFCSLTRKRKEWHQYNEMDCADAQKQNA